VKPFVTPNAYAQNFQGPDDPHITTDGQQQSLGSAKIQPKTGLFTLK